MEKIAQSRETMPEKAPHTTTVSDIASQGALAAVAYQRIKDVPHHMVKPADITVLQRTIGNRAVGQLLQAKMDERRAVQRQTSPCSGCPDMEEEIQTKPQSLVQHQAVPKAEEEIQTKPTVGAPNDAYEQEADQVADQVASRLQKAEQPTSIQQRAQHGSPLVTRVSQKPACSISDKNAGSGVKRGINSLRGGGSPLSDTVQAQMESAFGADFSSVRIHTGDPSAELNKRVNAKAFTTGNDIFFNKGTYRPNTDGGRRLLAHELTHTVQQTGGMQKKVQRNLIDARSQNAVHKSSSIRRDGPSPPAIVRRAPISIQKKVGEDQVASSNHVLTRISSRVGVADAHADIVVRILSALNEIIPKVDAPPEIAQLRDLIRKKSLFRALIFNLVRLAELGLEFNPGAGRDSPLNSFVYTCRCGWIDMGHFFISAFAAYGAGLLMLIRRDLKALLKGLSPAQVSLILGWYMEHFQEAVRQFISGPMGAVLSRAPQGLQGNIKGIAESAFTVEDLPSDKFGADIGGEVFADWKGAAIGELTGFSITEPEPFDIQGRMSEFFSNCTAVFPTGNTLKAMIKETVGTGKFPRQHFSTTPVLLTSALGLCPAPETAHPPVDERGWERMHPAGMIDEASDRTIFWNFGVAVTALKPEHKERLRLAAKASPSGAMIMVEGHASGTGRSSLNERLARGRAESAAAFLRSQRSDLRVGVNYFGERTPKPPGTMDSGEAMARNRRVEIYIVDVAKTRHGLPAFRLPTKAPLPTSSTGGAAERTSGSKGR